MRIIHQITVPVQCSAGPSPHRNAPGFCGYNGARVEILVVNSPSANFRDDANLIEPLESEIFEVEGTLEVVLDAFRQIVFILESNKKFFMEKMGPKRALDCPNCPPPSAIEDGDPNASHTWECQAKWSKAAKDVLTKSPELVQQQAAIIANHLEKLEQAHPDCGGCGCTDCEWTGKVLTAA